MSDAKRRLHLFYNAFQNSTDAIILTDLKGIITDVNTAFTKLFGWKRGEVIGKTTKILRSPITTDIFYNEMWQSIKNKGEWKGELFNTHKNGSIIPILLSITPILENKELIGYMGIDIDISERKRLEEKIVQSERLSVIGQMAAKIAHEIRNPLSSISLNAELLEDEIKSDSFNIIEAKSLLKSIMGEVDRLANLTNEYLQFSRLPKISSKNYDIGKIFMELSFLLETQLQTRNISLLLDLPKAPLFVKLDKDQIHRAILNLLKNSMESLNINGNIQVTVKATSETVQINVIDDGPGISNELKSKIFEPFYTTKEIGTGLGLALSKQIIEEHGGSLEYLTNHTRGAHFLIIIPR